MVTITLDNLNLHITARYDILREIHDYFSCFVEGHQFMGKYKAGSGDGKVSLFSRKTRRLPYGLIFDLLKFKKEYYPDDKGNVDPKVKELFQGREFDGDGNLKFKPRDYQEDCIKALLKMRSGIIEVGTSGGKSSIIAYIGSHLYTNNLTKKFVIIVPNLNLITQFKSDLIEYGINSDLIGEVGAQTKEWDKELIISTGQSLVNYEDKLPLFDGLFVDETHVFKSVISKELLEKMVNAKGRFGCSGTVPIDRLDNLNTKAYLGPVIREFGTDYLRKHGWIAPCTIHQIEINYKRKFVKGDKFHDVKDELFNNIFRMNLIKDKIVNIKENVKLLLVDRVEEGGDKLKIFFEQCPELSDHEVVFISGKTKKNEREVGRQKAIVNDKKLIIIASYAVFQAGVNIPSLQHVFLAAPSKSRTRILQSCGRSLRLHERKDIAHIYDLIDMGTPGFEKHSMTRENLYLKSSFDLETEEYHEKDFGFF